MGSWCWKKRGRRNPRFKGWYLVQTQEGFISDTYWNGEKFEPEDPSDPIAWFVKIRYPED